jgi:hypothetical protein
VRSTQQACVFRKLWHKLPPVAVRCSAASNPSSQVKLVKFLVNDVVVDVSYETLGGLCAVNFLQELGMFIGRQDLFKRSVILVPLTDSILLHSVPTPALVRAMAGYCRLLIECGIVMNLQIKAWCYYESRLLGAHHGLLSSYALEVLVLHICNLYHTTAATPLKVGRCQCVGVKGLRRDRPAGCSRLCVTKLMCNMWRSRCSTSFSRCTAASTGMRCA